MAYSGQSTLTSATRAITTTPPSSVTASDGRVTVMTRDLVDQFMTWLASAGAGKDTLRVRSRHLRSLAATTDDLLSLRTQDLADWLATFSWGHSARQQGRASLRMFYAWACDEGLIGYSPAARLPRVRHPRPKSKPTPLPVIAAALLRANPQEQRMILVARYAGLRRAEVAALHSDDLTTMPDGVTRAILCRGKGGHERTVPMHPAIASVIEGAHGFIFPGRNRDHLHPDVVGRRVSALLGPGWTMHSLRHRAANDWLAVSGDLIAVQELLGHASLTTTRIYLDPRQDVMRAAVMAVA